MRLSAEKGRLDRSLNTAEQELQEAQQQILMLQVGSHHSSRPCHKRCANSGPKRSCWQLVATGLATELVFLAVSHLLRTVMEGPAVGVSPKDKAKHML